MLLANDVQLELLNQFEKLSMLLCHLPLVVKQSMVQTMRPSVIWTNSAIQALLRSYWDKNFWNSKGLLCSQTISQQYSSVYLQLKVQGKLLSWMIQHSPVQQFNYLLGTRLFPQQPSNLLLKFVLLQSSRTPQERPNNEKCLKGWPKLIVQKACTTTSSWIPTLLFGITLFSTQGGDIQCTKVGNMALCEMTKSL